MAYSEIEEQKLIDSLMEDCNTYNDNVRTLNEGSEILNEAVWEKIKYGLSKLGRYKANGKILGKGKIDSQQAALIKGILEKKGNETIAALDAKIKEIDPEFPNNQHEEKFLQIIEAISQVYDSIIAAVKANTMPVDAANFVIEDLAAYVKKFLDTDLAASYSTLDEVAAEEPDPNHPAPAATPAYSPAAPAAAPAAPRNAADVRAGLQAKGGSITRDSERMKTLASNKLPLILAGLGTALGGLGWLAQTDWLKDLIMHWLGAGTPAEEAVYKTISGGAPDSRGFIHWASQIQKAPIRTGADVQAFVDKFGINNVQNMFAQNGGGTVQEQGQQLLRLIGGDNAHKSVGQLFNAQTFGDMKMGRNLFGVSKMGSFVSRVLVKQAVKATAGAGVGVAATVAGIGSVLVPLGIGLMGAGALVKLMRMKGQRQSRAKTLNDLFQSLQPILGTAENPVQLDTNGDGKTDTKSDMGGAAVAGEKKARNPRKPIDADALQNYITKLLVFMRQFEAPEVVGKPSAAKTAAKPADMSTSYGDSLKYGQTPTGGVGTNVNATRPNLNYNYVKEEEELDEVVLDEGTYIRDKRQLDMLNEKLGADKVKQFEAFLIKLASVKNAIKKMPETADAKVNEKLAKIKANPIMGMNFRELFVSSTGIDDPNDSVLSVVSNTLKEIGNSRYKYAGIIDKINIMEANVPVKPTNVTVRRTFVGNMAKFLGEIVGLYQAISRMKKQIGTTPEDKTGEAVTAMNEQAEKMRHLIGFTNAKRV